MTNNTDVLPVAKKEDLSNNNLVRLLEAVDSAANRNYLMTCSNSEVQKFGDYILDEESGVTKSLEQVSLFRLSRLIYGADENLTEKLKSFFLTFSGLQFNPSVFYVIQNRKVKKGKADDRSQDEYAVSFYIGIKPYGLNHSDSVASIAGNMLKETFSGVFLGSSIKEACYDEKAKIRNMAMQGGKVDVVCVSAQPSVKKDSDEKSVEQGLEYFIDVMRNRPYTAVLLATPVGEMAVQLRKREFENLYSKLSAFQKVTIAFGKNESNAISKSLSKSTTVTESNGDSFTTTNSRSTTISEGGSSGYSVSSSSGAGSSSSSSSTTWGRSETFGVSQSMGTTHNIAISDGEVVTGGDTKTEGSSLTNTIEVQNKGVEGLLEQLDENLKKIKHAESYGLWECAAYFMSESYEESMFAANTYKSLILGDDSTSERCHLIHWEKPSDDESKKSKQMNLCNGILSGEHPIIQTRDKIFRNVIPSTVVNGRDLAYFMRLPQKSIPGLAVDTIAAFERSVVSKSGTGKNKNSVIVGFGRVCHMDKEEIPISLDLNEFTKHCFVTGSTGSGKSTTTESLLQRCIEKGINFLVLEPAKGEYKKALKNVEKINIFTTHPLCESLLHINPFKFEEGIHVLEHIDRLLGIFSSCWELTAAMPAILKKGVERAYQSVGWDLVNSYYIGDKKPYEYPTFSTLVGELRKVIESSGYSAEAKGNYTGALVTRVESLTAGVLKQIFCNEYYTDPEVLFDRKTVVDLSRLGSAE
ncbi:MAG: DUF87 domain-containing protein, partial [bacterium]|nr:DUF87 domain-containing protein [bacterium]